VYSVRPKDDDDDDDDDDNNNNNNNNNNNFNYNDKILPVFVMNVYVGVWKYDSI